MSIFDKYPRSSFLSELTASPHVIDIAHRIAELFSALDGLEDPNFGAELDADPQSRIWEMMVSKILKDSGFPVLGSNGDGPDFTVFHRGKKIVVEAICPTHGEDGLPDSVPPLFPGPDYQEVPIDQMLLRIRGAIRDKKLVFDRYRAKGIISSDDLCVIAISSSKIDRARGYSPCLGVTATIGHGGPYAVFDSRTKECIKEGFLLKENVRKANGSLVDTLPFLDDGNASIAGILYSEASVYSLNYDLTEETYFIHNPKAPHCIPAQTFKVGHELWTVLSTGGDAWATYSTKMAFSVDRSIKALVAATS